MKQIILAVLEKMSATTYVYHPAGYAPISTLGMCTLIEADHPIGQEYIKFITDEYHKAMKASQNAFHSADDLDDESLEIKIIKEKAAWENAPLKGYAEWM